MGVDIHLTIVKDNTVIAEEIFPGRNTSWFQELDGDGWQPEYDHLNSHYGHSEQTPKEYIEKYESWTYGARHINVKEYKDWFVKYRPDKHAGWATTYEKWEYENKGKVPEDLPISLTQLENYDINEMHFIEYEDEYDCSRWLYNYLIDNNIDDAADLDWCYDR